MDEKMREMGIRAKHAAGVLATLTTEEKNAGLLAIADALRGAADRDYGCQCTGFGSR